MESRLAIYKKILSLMDQKRMNAQRQMHQRRDEVYKKVPEIEEIDRKINILGIEAAKKAALSPDNSQNANEAFQQEKTALLNRKKELLKEKGIDEDVLKIKYECEKCSDTGFVNGKMCSCFAQLLMDTAYNMSGVGRKYETFENFDFSYYSDDKNDLGMSPRKNIENIYNTCLKFAQNMGKDSGNLLFYGNPGLGKTYLCGAIAKEVVKKGFTVMYVTASQLFKELEKERFGDEEKELSDCMEDIASADLLIIDDLGTEFSTSFTVSALFNIINTRSIDKKAVIISTNFTLEDLAAKYGERVSSRIMGEYRILKFVGSDIRILKKFRG